MYIIKLTKQADKKRRLLPSSVRKNISKKLKLLQNWDITSLDLKKLK
jgi:mRNA-degrading endonuclease RelE of RelBE toxin-antitoxin system